MVKSMRGKQVDMVKLAAANSHKVALGNAGLNARGDRVNKQGAVIQTRESILSQYNQTNPKAVRQVGLNDIRGEVITAAEAVAKIGKKPAQRRKISD
jgi:hypothetical protein